MMELVELAKPKKERAGSSIPPWLRTWKAAVVGAIVLVFVIAAIAGPGSGSGSGGSSTQSQARAYIKANQTTLASIGLSVGTVQVDINALAKGQSGATLLGVAQAAQQAHDTVDADRATLDGYLGTWSSSSAVGFVEYAADDLKNAMGQIVAWTNTPNAAGTTATTIQKYHNALGEWDAAVIAIWKAAHESGPPTI
jgi:hypothetical protein